VRLRRLQRQFLVERASSRRLVAVVRAVGGVQAQIASAAELALAARVADVTRERLHAALWKRRRLVKTWSLRGTLHLHAADELPLWMAARRAVSGSDWHAGDGLTRREGRKVLGAIADALDGRCLLREELAEEVGRKVGAWAAERIGSGWAYLLGPASVAGLLVQGPPRGTHVTFVRADQWIGGWTDVDPEEALAEVLRRFLATYGPATPRAFREWTISPAFKVADARRLVESLGDEVEEVDVDGSSAWVLAGDHAMPDPAAGESIRLIPQYDCYVMGFREREHFVPDAARALLKEHPRGRFEGAAAAAWLLVDGVLAGMWDRRRAGDRLEIRVEPIVRLTAPQRRAVEAEAVRVGEFLGLEPALTIARKR
jgi:Winged helix DNA-binding domain